MSGLNLLSWLSLEKKNYWYFNILNSHIFENSKPFDDYLVYQLLVDEVSCYSSPHVAIVMCKIINKLYRVEYYFSIFFLCYGV